MITKWYGPVAVRGVRPAHSGGGDGGAFVCNFNILLVTVVLFLRTRTFGPRKYFNLLSRDETTIRI